VSPSRPAAVVVLAAGEGTRMRSATPKVLHEIAGRPLLGHVLAAARRLEPEHLVVVAGAGRAEVEAYLAASPDVQVVVQDEQRGTGHAVRTALAAIPQVEGTVVVLAGDVPLLTAETLDELLAAHVSHGNAATMLSANLPDPTGYGRVVRGRDGAVTAVVEHRDASDDERAIHEINTGTYAFTAGPLRAALARLSSDNAAGEEYLTDAMALLRDDEYDVGAMAAVDADETLGVNDQLQLSVARRLMRDRVLAGLMRDGVVVIDPATTWVDVDVVVEAGAVLLPSTRLHGASSVAAGAQIGPEVTLTDTRVGAGAQVASATCVQADIGPDATVGPYTYLRPGTRLERGAKAGGFVEIKNSTVGEHAKVPHLSYVGDAEIGSGTNIGAATVFVNYDGQAKHRTVVGDEVRIGSDTMLVAPVTVGDGAYTAAGSVITEDVPPGAMAVGRARQRVIKGWVGRKRPGTPAAEAASAADEAHGTMDAQRSVEGAADDEEQAQ
jgi:bifunctional UDP-N-acetylglucosamine pyrophosphorylase/glucosamine-1-phosphate N-acetyltransferase